MAVNAWRLGGSNTNHSYRFESCPDYGSMLPKRIEGLLPLAKNMTARKDEQHSQVVEWRHTLELLVKVMAH